MRSPIITRIVVGFVVASMVLDPRVLLAFQVLTEGEESKLNSGEIVVDHNKVIKKGEVTLKEGVKFFKWRKYHLGENIPDIYVKEGSDPFENKDKIFKSISIEQRESKKIDEVVQVDSLLSPVNIKKSKKFFSYEVTLVETGTNKNPVSTNINQVHKPKIELLSRPHVDIPKVAEVKKIEYPKKLLPDAKNDANQKAKADKIKLLISTPPGKNSIRLYSFGDNARVSDGAFIVLSNKNNSDAGIIEGSYRARKDGINLYISPMSRVPLSCLNGDSLAVPNDDYNLVFDLKCLNPDAAVGQDDKSYSGYYYYNASLVEGTSCSGISNAKHIEKKSHISENLLTGIIVGGGPTALPTNPTVDVSQEPSTPEIVKSVPLSSIDGGTTIKDDKKSVEPRKIPEDEKAEIIKIEKNAFLAKLPKRLKILTDAKLKTGSPFRIAPTVDGKTESAVINGQTYNRRRLGSNNNIYYEKNNFVPNSKYDVFYTLTLSGTVKTTKSSVEVEDMFMTFTYNVYDATDPKISMDVTEKKEHVEEVKGPNVMVPVTPSKIEDHSHAREIVSGPAVSPTPSVGEEELNETKPLKVKQTDPQPAKTAEELEEPAKLSKDPIAKNGEDALKARTEAWETREKAIPLSNSVGELIKGSKTENNLNAKAKEEAKAKAAAEKAIADAAIATAEKVRDTVKSSIVQVKADVDQVLRDMDQIKADAGKAAVDAPVSDAAKKAAKAYKDARTVVEGGDVKYFDDKDKSDPDTFVSDVKGLIEKKDIDGAKAKADELEKYAGSVKVYADGISLSAKKVAGYKVESQAAVVKAAAAKSKVADDAKAAAEKAIADEFGELLKESETDGDVIKYVTSQVENERIVYDNKYKDDEKVDRAVKEANQEYDKVANISIDAFNYPLLSLDTKDKLNGVISKKDTDAARKIVGDYKSRVKEFKKYKESAVKTLEKARELRKGAIGAINEWAEAQATAKNANKTAEDNEMAEKIRGSVKEVEAKVRNAYNKDFRSAYLLRGYLRDIADDVEAVIRYAPNSDAAKNANDLKEKVKYTNLMQEINMASYCEDKKYIDGAKSFVGNAKISIEKLILDHNLDGAIKELDDLKTYAVEMTGCSDSYKKIVDRVAEYDVEVRGYVSKAKEERDNKEKAAKNEEAAKENNKILEIASAFKAAVNLALGSVEDVTQKANDAAIKVDKDEIAPDDAKKAVSAVESAKNELQKIIGQDMTILNKDKQINLSADHGANASKARDEAWVVQGKANAALVNAGKVIEALNAAIKEAEARKAANNNQKKQEAATAAENAAKAANEAAEVATKAAGNANKAKDAAVKGMSVEATDAARKAADNAKKAADAAKSAAGVAKNAAEEATKVGEKEASNLAASASVEAFNAATEAYTAATEAINAAAKLDRDALEAIKNWEANQNVEGLLKKLISSPPGKNIIRLRSNGRKLVSNGEFTVSSKKNKPVTKNLYGWQGIENELFIDPKSRVSLSCVNGESLAVPNEDYDLVFNLKCLNPKNPKIEVVAYGTQEDQLGSRNGYYYYDATLVEDKSCGEVNNAKEKVEVDQKTDIPQDTLAEKIKKDAEAAVAKERARLEAEQEAKNLENERQVSNWKQRDKSKPKATIVTKNVGVNVKKVSEAALPAVQNPQFNIDPNDGISYDLKIMSKSDLGFKIVIPRASSLNSKKSESIRRKTYYKVNSDDEKALLIEENDTLPNQKYSLTYELRNPRRETVNIEATEGREARSDTYYVYDAIFSSKVSKK